MRVWTVQRPGLSGRLLVESFYSDDECCERQYGLREAKLMTEAPYSGNGMWGFFVFRETETAKKTWYF
ncbi:MAG: hypothetical protein JJE30_13680 [Desulfuromonadales bacterium]|nr:hypothetical protein [Desulfuromonadales bacterium]